MINHALFKLSLFMVAGVIIKTYGTRNIDEVGDLLKRLPLVGFAGILAVLGITGAPMFNGSISKYFIMDGTNWLITALFMMINLGTIIVFLKFSTMLFKRRDMTSPSMTKEPSPCHISLNKQIAVLVPGALCFLGGLFGEEFISFLFNVEVSVDAAGYTQKTLIYIASVVVGFLVYRYCIKRLKILDRVREIDIGFRGTCAAIGGFLAVVMVFAGFIMG
jgi:multicomponent Na+:H+ antiporter subunit D